MNESIQLSDSILLYIDQERQVLPKLPSVSDVRVKSYVINITSRLKHNYFEAINIKYLININTVVAITQIFFILLEI